MDTKETSLTIVRYKRISVAKLDNFSRVNWLVGRNDSGKTSVINAISHLTDGGNAKTFCIDGSLVSFSYGSKARMIMWEPTKKNPNHTSDMGDLNLAIVQNNWGGTEMGANNVTTHEFKYHALTPESHAFLNESAKLLNTEPTEVKTAQQPPFTTAPSRTILVDSNAREVDAQYFASGLRAINTLRWAFEPLKQVSDNADLIFLLLEEPENHLHPDLQKQVPQYIETIIDTLPKLIQQKLVCIVSTHSPFIIAGASKFESHKIYLLNNGSLVDLDMKRVEASDGYPVQKCSEVVGYMLGGDVTDLGYPENFIILEEASLQFILDNAKSKGLIKNITFISASGVVNASKLHETLKDLMRLNTLIKCNPFYGDRYKVILDNRAKLKKDQIEIYERLEKQTYNPLIELRRNDLEDYYPMIDGGIYKNFKEEFNKIKGSYLLEGQVKMKYEEQISNLVIDASSFSKLFNNELNSLLR